MAKVAKIKTKNNLFINKDIKAKTEPQRALIESYINGYNVLATGCAGTGKTFVALYLALKDVIEGEKHKIIIVRSAVQSRDIGALPGTLEEKTNPFYLPYMDLVNMICECGTAWETLTKKDVIETQCTSFLRGVTLDDSVIIIDEAQNMDAKELETILTRVGINTQVIVCGDNRQDDLFRYKEKSGLNWLVEVASKMPKWFSIVNFTVNDVIRSDFVGDFLKTLYDL